jgi:hypothetical protein
MSVFSSSASISSADRFRTASGLLTSASASSSFSAIDGALETFRDDKYELLREDTNSLSGLPSISGSGRVPYFDVLELFESALGLAPNMTAPPGEYPPDLAALFTSRIEVEVVECEELVSRVGYVGLAKFVGL